MAGAALEWDREEVLFSSAEFVLDRQMIRL